MSSLSHIHELFNQSGCLKASALEQYNNKSLTPDELKLVEGHLNSCMLCKDAVEGLSLKQESLFSATESKVFYRKKSSNGREMDLHIPDSQYAVSDKAERINKRLQKRFKYGAHSEEGRRRQLLLKKMIIPAAASILILAGIIALFPYFFPEKHDIAKVESTEKTMPDEKREMGESIISDTISTSGDKKGAPTIGGIANVTHGDDGDVPEDREAVPELTVIEPKTIETVTIEDEIIEQIDPGVEETHEVTEMEMAVMNADQKQARQITSKSKGGPDSQDASTIFTVAEKMPEFPGGEDSLMHYIDTHLVYPEKHDSKSKKTVLLTFVIDEEGLISDIRVLRGMGYEYQQAAIELVENMPPWKPGKMRGQAVRVQYNLEIIFDKKN